METAAIEGMSGAMGGIIALLSTYPLMTGLHLGQSERNSWVTCDPLRKVCHKLSAHHVCLQIISKYGWTGLYRGLEPALLGTAISQGVYFYFYSSLRQMAVARLQRRTNSTSEDIGVPASLLVAFLAGCGNVLLTNPIWTVATNMQGLWRGCLPSLIMVSNPTAQYVLYEWLVARLAEWRGRTAKAGVKPSPPTAAEFFLISAVAKLGATVLTYPLLVVKSRLQAANKDTHVDLKYTGAVDAVTRIWKHEGFFAFYDGMRAKMLQSVLAAALLNSIREKLNEAAKVMLSGPR
eukprot:jgi/Astpho2/8839/fgenesh1_pm.00129_%23_9_t